jgi:hypothetical protein
MIFLCVLFTWKACKKEDDSPVPAGIDGFVGTYLCKEVCTSNGSSSYQVKITKSSNASEVYLYNFYNAGTSKYIYGQVDGNTLEIPLQNYSSFTLSGSGNLNGNVINLSCSVDDGTILDSCSATLTRQ